MFPLLLLLSFLINDFCTSLIDSFSVLSVRSPIAYLGNPQARHTFRFACFSPLVRYRNMEHNLWSKRRFSFELVVDSHRSVRQLATLLASTSRLLDTPGPPETLISFLVHLLLRCCFLQVGHRRLFQRDSANKLLLLQPLDLIMILIKLV